MNGISLAPWIALVIAFRRRPECAPAISNSEPVVRQAPSIAPMSATLAAAGFRVPEGFHVSVFAAEPDVQNPIAMAWDTRGRLWVAENYTYAERTQRFDLRLRDRVLIFEDTDGDGRFDRRTVFTDEVQMLASVELGFGGVWLLCPPQLLFVPDRNGDDVPDGPAEVVLDGFTVPAENYHTFANGLQWGPDGWLYGRCGASSPGQIGAPGTPERLRVPLRGGLWRYHPHRKRFEVLAHGTTNPWGHDWNALGEVFFINTVNGHLWHMIPGAHFVRPHTIDPNPRAYALIDQHADHWHWDNSKELSPGHRARRRQLARRRPRPQRADDLPGRPVARGLPRQALHPELPRPPRERRAARTLGQRLRRPPRARHASSRPTPGSAAST